LRERRHTIVVFLIVTEMLKVWNVENLMEKIIKSETV
jgi:hypothetical protein